MNIFCRIYNSEMRYDEYCKNLVIYVLLDVYWNITIEIEKKY